MDELLALLAEALDSLAPEEPIDISHLFNFDSSWNWED